jgi:hypothetical protein
MEGVSSVRELIAGGLRGVIIDLHGSTHKNKIINVFLVRWIFYNKKEMLSTHPSLISFIIVVINR